MKRLVLLGATGSIGTQTIDVVLQHPDLYAIRALSAGHNVDGLREILKKIDCDTICIAEESDAEVLKAEYPEKTVYFGDEGLLELTSLPDYDLLVNALVGFTGFLPSLRGIETGHDVALANKETLVAGGELINEALKKYGRKLYPIDSEHSAIFQCLQGNEMKSVSKLWVTCSGGAFRNRTREELTDVTLADALAHPNWSMGAKITVDCANLMNKGFEVMEAHWLFDMDYDKISVVMHPESVIHSAVEYCDHSIIAQLGAPDMRLPIQYALSAPARLPLMEEKPMDFYDFSTLHFARPDTERFPLLALAYETGKKGGNLPAVMNGANDIANAAFRNGDIPFLMIEETVASAVKHTPFEELSSVEDLLRANQAGRDYALQYIKEKSVE